MRTADRVLQGTALLTIAGALGALVAGNPSVPTLLAGAAMVAVADLLRVRLTGERPSSLAVAPGLGIALLTGDAAVAIVAFALGTGLVGVIRRRLRREIPAASGGHLLSVAGGALAYAWLAPLDPTVFASADGSSALSPLAMSAAVLAIIGIDVAIRSRREDVHPRTIARALLPFQLAAASAAALFALAEPVLGAVAYPLFLAPLGATHHAFTQLTSVRRTFSQMIRALSSVPEIAGYSHPGHAARTAAIARAIGRELRLRERDLGEVEIAARLHDLGRMRARTPDDVDALPAAELAASGAAVVRSTGALPRVASIIERAHDAYDGDLSIPIGARIIRAASTFDDLTATGDGALSDARALESMRRGSDDRFDPSVLDALARVVRA